MIVVFVLFVVALLGLLGFDVFDEHSGKTLKVRLFSSDADDSDRATVVGHWLLVVDDVTAGREPVGTLGQTSR